MIDQVRSEIRVAVTEAGINIAGTLEHPAVIKESNNKAMIERYTCRLSPCGLNRRSFFINLLTPTAPLAPFKPKTQDYFFDLITIRSFCH
jgi:hypothetical protein